MNYQTGSDVCCSKPAPQDDSRMHVRACARACAHMLIFNLLQIHCFICCYSLVLKLLQAIRVLSCDMSLTGEDADVFCPQQSHF